MEGGFLFLTYIDFPLGRLSLKALVTLLDDGKSDTVALGERDSGSTSANDENVGDTGGELVAYSILDMDNVEAAKMTLSDFQHSDTSQIVTSGNHDGGSNIELVHLLNLSSSEVELDGIVDLDNGVGVTKSATVVGDDEGDGLCSELLTLDLQELELLLFEDSVH
jgi:hypothetical protein